MALALGTAGTILWQNAHIVVLWDASYVLDSAVRMAEGQMPYRDFPFAHAPLTFLLQAAIIRVFGRVFFHHVLYAALAGAAGTVLAWRIALDSLRGRVRAAWMISLLLAAPLTVLGIYCVVPLPNYDCDCGLAVLAAVWMLLRADVTALDVRAVDARSAVWRGFTAGVAACAPLFFKQNIGLPFLLAFAGAAVWVLAVRTLPRATSDGFGRSRAPLVALLAGALAGLLAAAWLIHCTAGLRNYLHWTIQFAAQRRLPGTRVMLDVYRDPSLLWSLPCAALGMLLLSYGGEVRSHPRRKSKNAPRVGHPLWAQIAGFALFAAPFLYTLSSLFLYDDADERGDSLLALWPFLLVLAGALALVKLVGSGRAVDLRVLTPFVLLAAIHGAFLSQQLWGSTYGIWPLLVLLLAEMIAFVAEMLRAGASDATGAGSLSGASLPQGLKPQCLSEPDGPAEAVPLLQDPLRLSSSTGSEAVRVASQDDGKAAAMRARVRIGALSSTWLAAALAALVSATLLVCGGFYTASEERLSYAQFPDGPVASSAFPALRGMATPGEYIPQFDELLHYAAANIPENDGLILIPGEDPFYFATGRVPRFPVLLFDPATDPYSPAEIAELARTRDIRWLMVKRDLQIKEDPTPEREATLKALLMEFKPAARLRGYDVYRR